MVSIRSDDIRGRWGRLIDNTASFTSLDLSGQISGVIAAISGQTFPNIGNARIVVWESGGTAKAIDINTGLIISSGTSDGLVINNAMLSGLTVGRTYKEVVRLVGEFNISGITIPNYTVCDWTMAKLIQLSGANTNMITNYDQASGTSIDIIGGYIDGNKDNQAASAGTFSGEPFRNQFSFEHLYDSSIIGSYLTNSNGFGMYVRSCNNINITRNTITSTEKEGICLRSGASINIHENTISGTDWSWVTSILTTDVSIQNNLCDTTLEATTGFAINGQRTQMKGNILRNTHHSTIVLSQISGNDYDASDSIIEGNIMTNTSANFVANTVMPISHIIIKGNLMDGANGGFNTSQGIAVGINQTDWVIEGNIIRNCDDTGIRVSNPTSGAPATRNITIVGNQVYNCGKASGGTAQQRAGITVRNNNVANSTIQNITVMNNRVYDTSGTQIYGLWIEDVIDSVVANNDFGSTTAVSGIHRNNKTNSGTVYINNVMPSGGGFGNTANVTFSGTFEFNKSFIVGAAASGISFSGLQILPTMSRADYIVWISGSLYRAAMPSIGQIVASGTSLSTVLGTVMSAASGQKKSIEFGAGDFIFDATRSVTGANNYLQVRGQGPSTRWLASTDIPAWEWAGCQYTVIKDLQFANDSLTTKTSPFLNITDASQFNSLRSVMLMQNNTGGGTTQKGVGIKITISASGAVYFNRFLDITWRALDVCNLVDSSGSTVNACWANGNQWDVGEAFYYRYFLQLTQKSGAATPQMGHFDANSFSNLNLQANPTGSEKTLSQFHLDNSGQGLVTCMLANVISWDLASGSTFANVNTNTKLSMVASINDYNIGGTGLNSGAVFSTDYDRIRTGAFLGSGNGVTTVYAFAHGLSTAPNSVQLTPASLQATSGTRMIASGGTTNIDVTFTSAPTSGDVRINWHAQV